MMNHAGNLTKIQMQYWSSRVILTAIELDLFTILGNRFLTAEQLSTKLGIIFQYSYDFFDALVALGFLKRQGDNKETAKYWNFDDALVVMDKTNSFVLTRYNFWNNLKEVLITGKALTDEVYADDTSLEHNKIEEFYAVMDNVQEESFRQLVKVFDFSQYQTMLDLGAASGLLSKIVHKEFPKLIIQNFDLSFSLSLKNNNEVQNISYITGDFFKDQLPQSDVITMCNTLIDWNIDKKKQLIKRAYDALTERGVLIIVEKIIDDLRRNNVYALLMSLNSIMEFGEGGGSFTNHEFKECAKAVGFRDFKLLPLIGETCAIFAYKVES